MTDLLPIREVAVRHRCRCVLVFSTGYRDRCPQVVDDPDSPLCAHCEESHRNAPPIGGDRFAVLGVDDDDLPTIPQPTPEKEHTP